MRLISKTPRQPSPSLFPEDYDWDIEGDEDEVVFLAIEDIG